VASQQSVCTCVAFTLGAISNRAGGGGGFGCGGGLGGGPGGFGIDM